MSDETQIRDLIAAFYDVLSGQPDEDRDWDLFRSLFFESARLVPVNRVKSTHCFAVPFDVDAYIIRLQAFLKEQPFFETGKIQTVEIAGKLAQAKTMYVARSNPSDSKLLKKGNNLVQFIHDGRDWKIMNMLWEDE